MNSCLTSYIPPNIIEETIKKMINKRKEACPLLFDQDFYDSLTTEEDQQKYKDITCRLRVVYRPRTKEIEISCCPYNPTYPQKCNKKYPKTEKALLRHLNKNGLVCPK